MLMLPDGGFTLNETESNLEEQLALALKYNLTVPVKLGAILNCVVNKVESENAPEALLAGYQ